MMEQPVSVGTLPGRNIRFLDPELSDSILSMREQIAEDWIAALGRMYQTTTWFSQGARAIRRRNGGW